MSTRRVEQDYEPKFEVVKEDACKFLSSGSALPRVCQAISYEFPSNLCLYQNVILLVAKIKYLGSRS